MPWFDERSVVKARRTAEECRRDFVRGGTRNQVYVLQAFTRQECCELRRAAEAVAALSGWTTQRHSAYATRDLPVDALPPDTACKLRLELQQRVLAPIAERAGFEGPEQLCLRDLFIVCYDCNAGGQRQLELHRDGSLLSFNVLLCSESEFQGGGTFLPHLLQQEEAHCAAHTDGTVHLLQGEACVHSGSALHAGAPITSGLRMVLVGFVESVR